MSAQHRDKYAEKTIGRRNRQHRRADGTAKRLYSRSEAEAIAKRMVDRGSPRASAYQCPACGWWHVGSSKWGPK